MIINRVVVIYYLFLFFSFALGLLGASIGLYAAFLRKSDISPETRYKTDKYLYLCSSAMHLGIWLRIIMVPLWFYMLQNLIPLIPGAMCLAGVHQNVPIYSWVSSSLKLFLPLLYFAWIVISMIDKKFIEQPFLKFRYYFLAPLLILIFIEIFFDIRYLLFIKPVKVTCCTAMFDLNTGNVPKIFTESHWYWIMAFCITFIIQNLLMLKRKMKKYSYFLISLFSTLLFISLLFSLHTKLSPLILNAPFHHCIFCLLQINMYVLTGTVLLLIGIYMAFTYGIIGFLSIAYQWEAKVMPYMNKIKFINMALYISGFLILLFITITSLANENII